MATRDFFYHYIYVMFINRNFFVGLSYIIRVLINNMR